MTNTLKGEIHGLSGIIIFTFAIYLKYGLAEGLITLSIWLMLMGVAYTLKAGKEK